MSLTPEAMYNQLGILITNRPPLEGLGQYTQEQYEWLGRVSALIEATGDIAATMAVQTHASRITSPGSRSSAYGQLMVALYGALAKAELAVPARAQGAFIDVGQSFTALQAVGKVLGSAAMDVLIVDPYLNLDALFAFVPTTRDGIPIRLLCDSRHSNLNAELKTGVERWQQQYASAKPLEARSTPPRALHDR